MNQQYRLTLKQRTDGQIRVSSVRVPSDVLKENPFIKEEMKNNMEKMLEKNHMRVLKDVGVVDFD